MQVFLGVLKSAFRSIWFYFMPNFFWMQFLSICYYSLCILLYTIVLLLIKVNYNNFKNEIFEMKETFPLWYNILCYYPIIAYLAYNGFFILSTMIFLYFYMFFYVSYCKDRWYN